MGGAYRGRWTMLLVIVSCIPNRIYVDGIITLAYAFVPSRRLQISESICILVLNVPRCLLPSSQIRSRVGTMERTAPSSVISHVIQEGFPGAKVGGGLYLVRLTHLIRYYGDSGGSVLWTPAGCSGVGSPKHCPPSTPPILLASASSNLAHSPCLPNERQLRRSRMPPRHTWPLGPPLRG